MAKPQAPVKILDVLKEEAITLNIQATAKQEALLEMIDLLFKQETPEIKREIFQALLDREKLGSTGIGSGVAVPHAKSNRMDKVICAFGISKKGVAFEASDGAPVYLVFLLVAPVNSQSEHLNILARIVRLLKDRAFRQALRDAGSVQEIVSLIINEDT